MIPRSISAAIGVGIGLFLTIIGLSSSGLGVISGGVSTPLQLAGCLPQYQDANGFCESHVLQDPRIWVGVFCGGVLTLFLFLYRVKGEWLPTKFSLRL
jgi:AGZA family xanthine/uracil permease-like MFS transporter